MMLRPGRHLGSACGCPVAGAGALTCEPGPLMNLNFSEPSSKNRRGKEVMAMAGWLGVMADGWLAQARPSDWRSLRWLEQRVCFQPPERRSAERRASSTSLRSENKPLNQRQCSQVKRLHDRRLPRQNTRIPFPLFFLFGQRKRRPFPQPQP
jgi:hypothetical protein